MNDIEINFDIITKLSDCSTIITGSNIDKNKLNKNFIGTPYIVGASNIKNGQVVIDTFIDEALLKNPAISKKGDIIISIVGTLGKIGINTIGRAVLSKHVAAIRLKKGISTQYALAMIMRSILELVSDKEEGKLGFQQKLDVDELLKIKFVLPSLILQEYAVSQMTSIANIILAMHIQKDDLLSFSKMIKIISESKNEYRKQALNSKNAINKMIEVIPTHNDECLELIEELKHVGEILSKIA